MPHPAIHSSPSEIKLFYQTYGENNFKPQDAVLLTPNLDQKFGQDMLDDLVNKGLWNEAFETQLENNQLYFKVFRDDEDMIPVDAIEFDNIRMLPNRGLLGLEEPLQNALSRSANWFGSFIPESVKQTAYDFGNSFAQWTEDKLTGLSAYSSIPKVEAMDEKVWQEILEESELLHSTHNDTEENTAQTITTTSTSYLDSILATTWNALTYAANNPLKTLILTLAASSLANRFHLPKMKFENPSLDFTNGISTATNILTKLAVTQIATRGQIHTPMSTILTGMSLWDSVAATSPEFLVNSHTTNSQLNPSVASFGNGNFVVVWQSDAQDGSSIGVYGQRFNATGTKIGSEFLVNTYTTGNQQFPSVASFLNDSFVVTWQSSDGSLDGIYGQRFNATGAKIGSEFQVNTYTTNTQSYPSVASFADGNFVVTWQNSDGHWDGIYGQRFNATGAKTDSEFQVNTYTTNSQSYPSVASFADGSFMVTWMSEWQDGASYAIYGQRCNATGVKVGLEFQVNTYTTNAQSYPSVASFADGSFVVTWESDGQDGSGNGIYGQRFNATSAKIGPEFQGNTYALNDQQLPSVATFVDNSFVVTWMSYGQDGSTFGIYAQQFNAAGAKIGSEFQVNAYTTDAQRDPCVASFLDGSFVVTWQSNGQDDGSTYGVYGRIFTPPRLNNNTLTLSPGQTKVLTGTMLSASAPHTDLGALVFTISDLARGRFEFLSSPGIPISTFTQQQVIDAQVQFVHDGTGYPPAYNTKVSEAVLDTTPTPATIIFTHAMPVLANSGTVPYAEKNPPVPINGIIIVFDADSSTLSNATIRFISSVLPEDVLGFTNQAGISGVYNNATGILSLNGISSVSNYQLALRNITYFNPSFNPSTALRTVSFTVNDGQFESNTVTCAMSIIPINDAPVLVGSGGSVTFTEKTLGVIIDPNIVLTDVDNLNMTSAVMSISNNFVSGEDVLNFVNQNGIIGNYNTGILTLTGSSAIANYQTALRNITYINTSSNPSLLTRTISFTVNDDALSSNSISRTANIIPADDAPTLTGSGWVLSFTEKDPATVIDPNIVVADVDNLSFTNATVRFIGGALAEDVLAFTNQAGISGVYNNAMGILLLNGTASVANYQLALRNVKYFNPSLNPSTILRNVSFTVNDGQLDSNAVIRSISITPVNDEPVLVDNDFGIIFTEKSPPLAIKPNIVVTDVDSLNMVSARIWVWPIFAGAEDVLGFVNQNGISGNYNTGTGMLTLTGSATINDYQTALRNVTFSTSNHPSLLTRTIFFTVNDGGLDSGTVTGSADIIPVNDASLLTGSGGTLSFTEKDSATAIDPNIIVADVDNPNLTNATARFIGSVLVEDVLSFTTQAGVSGSYSSSTGILALTGSAPLANYQLALRSVTYFNPSLNPSSAMRTVSFIVNDGQLDSNVVIRSIKVVPVNDPPELTVNTVTITGGKGLIFSLGQLQATDVDNTLGGLTFIISGLQFCRFERVDAAGSAITSFTQQEITDGKIRFVASEATSKPTYQVSVSDGQSNTIPQAASVSFSEGSPVTPSAPSNVGTTTDPVRNALIAAGISGAIGMGFFALKYGIKRAGNKKLQAALDAKRTDAEKQQRNYNNEVIKPIANHINGHLKITGAFESISIGKVKDFIGAVEIVVSEMGILGVHYQHLSEAERNIVHTTIVKELKQIAHSNDENSCTALMRCRTFKADITPQQIEENAEKVAQAVEKALNRSQLNAVTRNSDPKTPHDLVLESVELKPITSPTVPTSSKPEAPRVSTLLPKLAEERVARQRIEREMEDMKKQMAQLLSAQTGSPIHTAPTPTSSDVVASASPQRPDKTTTPIATRFVK